MKGTGRSMMKKYQHGVGSDERQNNGERDQQGVGSDDRENDSEENSRN